MTRLPNNPTTDVVVLGALRQVIVPNTNLALISASGTGLENVYIQNKYAISQGVFPAVHLYTGKQHYLRDSRSTYIGTMEAVVEYYDRWDSQPNTIDTVRAAIAADLERMKANVESNEQLTIGITSYTVGILKEMLSPYPGEFDRNFPGLHLVYRTFTITFNILPFDV